MTDVPAAKNGPTMLLNLPEEILIMIIGFQLDIQTILSLRRVRDQPYGQTQVLDNSLN